MLMMMVTNRMGLYFVVMDMFITNHGGLLTEKTRGSFRLKVVTLIVLIEDLLIFVFMLFLKHKT